MRQINLRAIGIEISRPIDTSTNTPLVEILKVPPKGPESPGTSEPFVTIAEKPGANIANTKVAPDKAPGNNRCNQA